MPGKRRRLPPWGNFDLKILTFIIPAYNSQAYLDKCVSSMLVPELMDRLDILIVNDGSTDETARIAEKYCAQYPDSIRLITQENRGHGGALNTGCAAAAGKYLKVIDADDWVETENLPAFLGLLENCDSDVVLTHYHTIDVATGEIRNWCSSPQCFGESYPFGQIMANWRSFDQCLTFHGIAYHTAFYQRYGHPLPEHVFYEDHFFATYPCCYARSITPCDLFLYDYRVGDVNQSVSQANQLKRIGHIETVLDQMIQIYCSLACAEDGKGYAAMKIQGLLLSYLITALLVERDKKSGRQMAAKRMEELRMEVPDVYKTAVRKYQVFLMMNRLHMTKEVWEKILRSKAYSVFWRKHGFRKETV